MNLNSEVALASILNVLPFPFSSSCFSFAVGGAGMRPVKAEIFRQSDSKNVVRSALISRLYPSLTEPSTCERSLRWITL